MKAYKKVIADTMQRNKQPEQPPIAPVVSPEINRRVDFIKNIVNSYKERD